MRVWLVCVLACAACDDDAGVGVAPDLATADLAVKLSQDAVPGGAVSFVRGAYCPDDWELYHAARGRFLVPRAGGFDAGAVTASGTPLTASEDRVHDHAFSAPLALDATSFVGVAGGGNGSPAEARTLTLSATANRVSAGLPYVQLLVCKKTTVSPPASRPLPAGLLQFFDAEACPSGWSRPDPLRGRHLVGLPAGASPGATFGGAPLSVGEERLHSHDVTPTLTPASTGIALASGCCGGGYAAHKSYNVAASSQVAAAGLPTLHLLMCRKD
jgi:hypothetical protein